VRRVLWILLFCCAWTPLPGGAQSLYSYRTFDRASGAVSDRSHVRFDRSQPGEIRLEFERGLPDFPQKETYVFSESYETVRWTVENRVTGTDYTGLKQKQRVVIRGRLNSEVVAKELDLDDKPFFAFPKFELTPLASAAQGTRTEFWALRPDTLDAYEMIAVNRGPRTIDLEGRPTLATAIDWYPANPLLRAFRRTYYYRADDGLFVKQEYSDGRVRELTRSE